MRHVTLALAVLAVAAPFAGATRLLLAPPLVPVAVRAAVADVALVGTVTAIEPATVPALPYPGADKPVMFTVAVVKVDTAARGADGLTHVRVGCPADPDPDPRPAAWFTPRAVAAAKLAAGQKLGLFLVRHPGADFLVIPPGLPPVDPDTPAGKVAIADMPRAAKVVADPVAALKVPDAKGRAFAAMVMVAKYRTPSVTGAASEVKPVAAAESALVLAALAEQEDWLKIAPGGTIPVTQFHQLGLTAADGYTPPVARPGALYTRATRAAYLDWLAGPGKDYRIKALVPKAEPKPVRK